MQFTLRGSEGVIEIEGRCVTKVEAHNHDNTLRCEMCLYQTQNDHVCQRIDHADSGDTYYRLERCSDDLEIYQFFGTEPLANYLYGCAGILVPGMCRTDDSASNNQ